MKSGSKNKLEKEIAEIVKEMDKCSDEHCGDILTTKQMKKEMPGWIKTVKEKCGPTNLSASNKEEYAEKREKYNKCFNEEKEKSSFQQKIKKRAECSRANCKDIDEKFDKLEEKMYQQNMNKKGGTKRATKGRTRKTIKSKRTHRKNSATLSKHRHVRR
jgi:hypothetical protein